MIGNLRDLGGIRTGNGKTVRRGLFVRCATLAHADEEDIRMLAVDYGIKRDFDLRTPNETERHPDPVDERIEYIAFPLAEEAAVGLSRTSGESLAYRMAEAPTKEEMYAMVPDMADVYVRMLREGFSRAQFRLLLRELLDPENLLGGASLYHCSSGKDRTGMTSAAILLVLGAERGEIIKDYMSSLEYAEKDADIIYERCMEGFGGDERASMLIRDLCTVKERYIDAFLDEIDAQFGSPEGFIRDYLGMSAAELDMVRNIALE